MKELLSKAPMILLVLFLFQQQAIQASMNTEVTIEIETAFIVSKNQMRVALSQSVNPEEISIYQNGEVVSVLTFATEARNYLVTATQNFDFTKPYEVRVGQKNKTAQVHWKAIDEQYTFDGELGAIHTPSATEFRLWAPLATEVKMQVFENGDDSIPSETHTLTRGEKGVWYATLEGDYHGKFYSYFVTNYGETKEVLDPYAKSMAMIPTKGFQVGRAAVVNPSLIGPKLDYANLEHYEKREDAIIWEIHVRDFTVDPSLELEAQFGTYKAFSEKLDYIKNLGVTHVQLLPVMSFALGDESINHQREWEYAVEVNYNWGYDPHSYFAPEGMYSENPEDPLLRVKELKELVQAIHAEGLGVTLDVVYNHTARVSIFEDIVPGYYHFMDATGETKESYGGGRVGTTHAMARKLVIDSILFWMEQYKVDGYRFDLMGDLDAETVQLLYDAALEKNPNVLMVGECWRTFAGDDGESVQPADQDWMGDTNSVACFSDEIRNELKSGYGSEGEQRFITGGARSIQTIFNNVIAKPGNTTEDDPGDILQYIAAHDNLTLHDVIAYSANLDPATDSEEIHRRIRLGNALILTSQGVAFLHAGQEYGRTKQWLSDEIPAKDFHYVEGFEHPYFIENSYDASDIVNYFNWEKVTEEGVHKATLEYTRGLIALRKSTDAFRLGTEELVAKNVRLIESPDISETDLVIAYAAKATDGTEFVVFVNADSKERTIRIAENLTGGTILVDADEATASGVSEPTGVQLTETSLTIAPLTTVIIKK